MSSASESQQHIIVVGAGPVGLMAAYLLGERGIPFVLIGDAPVLETDLRASTFHPPTLDMLDQHGLAEPLIAQGLVTASWQIRMHESAEKAEFDLSVIASETGHPFRLQCEQSKLCALILARLQKERKGEIRLGLRVDHVEQDDESVTVRATPLDESGGTEPEIFVGRFLIGADGARSTVRRAMGFAFEGKTYPETTILATTRFPFHEHLEGLSNVNYVWKPGGTFSLLRLPNLWRCSLYPENDETIEQALTPESIARKLGEIVPAAGLQGADEIRPYRIHMRIADDYRRGRVLLAGDAAHINSPSGGMGMNGGVHDAFELVATLDAVWNGQPIEMLDRYTRRRRPVAKQEVLAQADRNRARMQERDSEKRRTMLGELQAITADRDRAREYLLRSSMITGLRNAAEVA